MDDYDKSTELSRKFDIVLEMEKSLDEIDKAFEFHDTDDVPEMITYLKFLVKDLDKLLSGENEGLRYREFVLKRR